MNELKHWFSAAKNGNENYIALHLNEYGGATDQDGTTALIKAVSHGHLHLVELLLRKEARRINSRGEFALLAAVLRNDIKACRMLVQAEHDICLSDRRTALHVAVQRGHCEILPVLTQYIRDSYDDNGYSVFDYGVLSGSMKLITTLQELLNPNRSIISAALTYCTDPDITTYLKELYDNASQRYYDSLEYLSIEVDKLLSAVPSSMDTNLEASRSSMHSDLCSNSMQKLLINSAGPLASAPRSAHSQEKKAIRPPTYRKASPITHPDNMRSNSFSYSTSNPAAVPGEKYTSHHSNSKHTLSRRRSSCRSDIGGEQRAESKIEVADQSTQTSEADNALEIEQLAVLTEENAKLADELKTCRAAIQEKDIYIAQLEGDIQRYKDTIAQLNAAADKRQQSPQSAQQAQLGHTGTNDLCQYNFSMLTDSVVNSRAMHGDANMSRLLDTTQSSTVSTRHRHRSSKSSEAADNQINELIARLKAAQEQLKRASQREQKYEDIKQNLIAISGSAYLQEPEHDLESSIITSMHGSYAEQDLEWASSMATASATIVRIKKTLIANLHAIGEQRTELEKVRADLSKAKEQQAQGQNVEKLQATIRSLHQQLEERGQRLENAAELQIVKAELSSLQCKHEILLKKTAKLEQQSSQRGYNEAMFAEKLNILQDIQERGYLADPAYRLLLTRCEDLEGKLQESKKQNEHLIAELLNSKIRASKVEKADSGDTEPTFEQMHAALSNSRPPTGKKVRIQSKEDITQEERLSTSEKKEESERPLVQQSRRDAGGNFFDLQLSKSKPLPMPPASMLFKESVQYNDMLTTTMLNSTMANSSVLRSNLYGEIQPDGTTPLMLAAAANDTKKAEKHMRYAGMAKSDGTTALMIAAEHGSINVAEMLIKDEACMFREDGLRALEIAESCGNATVAILLRPVERPAANLGQSGASAGRIYTELMSAAETGNMDNVTVLAKYQAGMADPQGKTALMYAAAAGNTEIVKLLLDKEAGKQDDAGRTALMYACMHGHPDCVEILLPEEISIQDNKGNKPLRYAVDKASHGDRNVENRILELLCIAH